MRVLQMKHAFAITTALVLMLISHTASAQWAARDAGGSVQYIATRHLASVPQDRILQRPAVSTATDPTTPAALAARFSRSDEGSTAKWVDQNADVVKRRQERLDHGQ